MTPPMPQDLLPQTDPAPEGSDTARQQAIKAIERRRRFRIELLASAVGMGVVVLVWALTEYHNAGGWPTHGFSQSSGIHDVWNDWIVYPAVAWVLLVGVRAATLFGHRPITEQDIARELERTGHRHER